MKLVPVCLFENRQILFEAVWNRPLQIVVLLVVEAVPLEKVLDICLLTPPLVSSWESEVENQICPYANKIDDSQRNTSTSWLTG